jgi:ABC-2 type transport system ATP-binding protein
MELAAHWHRCQILQTTSEYFHQHSTQREASLSSEAVSPGIGFQLARQFSRCSKIPVIVRSLVFRLLENPCRLPTTNHFGSPGCLPCRANHAIIGENFDSLYLCTSLKGGGSILNEMSETVHQADCIISTSRLTKAFGKLVAVNDLHLEVMRGDVFGFLGPNGSGKTTTIRMLLGLIRPTAGRVVIFGMDTDYQLPAILQRVGAIVETPVFYPYLSGMDNLLAVAAASGMQSGRANRHRVEEVLELVELRPQANMAYRKYSLGMKQRLGIAAALLTDPELVLLDEPTNGLDPSGMFEIRQLIQRLAALGKTIFLSSHLLNEVQQVCNRVAILQRGNLIKQGNVGELLRGSEQVLVRLNAGEETQAALAALRGAKERGADWIGAIAVESDRQGQPTLRIDAPKARSAEINALLAAQNLFAAELHPYVGSLEEIFLQLTTPNNNDGRRGMAGFAAGGQEPSAINPYQNAAPVVSPIPDRAGEGRAD